MGRSILTVARTSIIRVHGVALEIWVAAEGERVTDPATEQDSELAEGRGFRRPRSLVPATVVYEQLWSDVSNRDRAIGGLDESVESFA